MNFRNTSYLRTAFLLVLIGDLLLACLQYYHMPLDGDLYALVLPAPWYAEVLQDPMGIDVWLQDASYGGAGRFFAHWSMVSWFRSVPFVFQLFVDPVSSVYASATLFKLLMHIGVIGIVAAYISGNFRIWNTDYLRSAAMTVPFVQTYSLYSHIGLIDHSITYVFFYIFPVLIFLLLLFPLYRYYILGRWQMKGWLWIVWGIGVLFVSQFGPMIQTIMVLTGIILLIYCGLSAVRRQLWSNKPGHFNLPAGLVLAVFFVLACAVYGYLTGMANVENKASLPLIEAYNKAFDGLNEHYFSEWYFYALTGWWLCNCVLLHQLNVERANRLGTLYVLALLFVTIYLILIPLGGYRSYRPLIYRYDLLIPVTLIGMYCLLSSSRIILQCLNQKRRMWYAVPIGIILLVLFIIDVTVPNKNQCEREQLETLAQTEKDSITLPGTCPVMSWKVDDNPYFTKKRAKMMRYWNIIDHDLIYTQEKMKAEGD